MIDLALFVVVSIIGLVSAALVFMLKDILHAALALSGFFLVNSLIFLIIAQPLLAIIQLFILVGGITTFIFVGVASSAYSKFKYTKVLMMLVLWFALFLVMTFPLSYMNISASQSNIFNSDSIAQSLSATGGIYYIMLFMAFGVSLGAILLLRKAGGEK